MSAGRPTRRFEGRWRRLGVAPVAGVDEAGRGCLAGPVVAAAVILPRRPPRGIDDSKRLTPRAREALLHALESSGAPIAAANRGHWRSLPTATAISPSAVANVS